MKPNLNLLSKILLNIVKYFFSVDENKSKELGEINSILIVRQHNQLGDLLAGTSLIRALKEKYPQAKISFILSPQNYIALEGNKLVDFKFVFDKKKLCSINYIKSLKNFLSKNYDMCLVPVTVSISFTSNFLARLSNSKVRVGANSLNGINNPSSFLFDRRIDLDWRHHPDSHIADRILDLVRPFGIDTKDFKTEIFVEDVHKIEAEKFINQIRENNSKKLIGIHPGAGKKQNIWNLNKVVELIKNLKNEFDCVIYFTGTDADKNELDFIKNNLEIEIPEFRNKPIQETAALIELSDLFITVDTGTMHIAGSTNTPVISLFGPTNPYNWAPVGQNKFFIRKSDFINDIEVSDVLNLVRKILK